MNKMRTLILVLSAVVILMLTAIPGCAATQGSPSFLTTIPPVSTTVATTSSPSATSTKQVTIDLTAQNIAFDKSVITVPAGTQITINFVNKDNVGHNFAAYTNEAATTPIFIGEIISSSSITYTFTAPSAPGTYFFRCDPHARIMKGQFIVQ
jgi:plastocyanin